MLELTLQFNIINWPVSGKRRHCQEFDDSAVSEHLIGSEVSVLQDHYGF